MKPPQKSNTMKLGKLSEVFETMLRVFCLSIMILLSQSDVHADAYVERAKALFGEYAKSESAFDAAVADLYSDSAVIRNKRRYPNGSVRVMALTGAQYKALIRLSMPLAKARNDKSNYSRVTYKRVGGKVKISAQRYLLLKKYTSPLTLIVMPNSKKRWLIVEENSESRP